uniref:Uncharacterized protein n=2 Tax=Picea TaxID=3328 RepID=A0A101LVJ1_PICGL|nr:hypothetical protein ABT39_MTgene1926 [Picea glauca]QHR89913.1 hypothetical protein Q903MT_gene3935 [Picea sitchensis]
MTRYHMSESINAPHLFCASWLRLACDRQLKGGQASIKYLNAHTSGITSHFGSQLVLDPRP